MDTTHSHATDAVERNAFPNVPVGTAQHECENDFCCRICYVYPAWLHPKKSSGALSWKDDVKRCAGNKSSSLSRITRHLTVCRNNWPTR
jgi:hypothetical protein